MSATQISAYISIETKNQVDSYVKRHGVKKAFLIEEALTHHLQVLRDIPEDVVVPSRLVLTEASARRVADLLDTQQPAPKALKQLLKQAKPERNS